MTRDIHWVHINQGKWMWANTVHYPMNGDRWGTAMIGGEWYSVCWSNDGDGYTQLADQDIDRYHAHQQQKTEYIERLSEYAFEMLQLEWLLVEHEYLRAARDWASIGFANICGRAPRKSEQGMLLQAGVRAVHRYLCQQSLDMGILYTFGYTRSYADDLIEQLIALGILVVDIRFSATSRAAKWREAHLRMRLGDSYIRLQELGNVNYNRPGGIELYRPVLGVTLAGERLLQGQHLAFMCMCDVVEECHRALAAKKMIERYPPLKIAHV